jgi:hypothetical protein
MRTLPTVIAFLCIFFGSFTYAQGLYIVSEGDILRGHDIGMYGLFTKAIGFLVLLWELRRAKN